MNWQTTRAGWIKYGVLVALITVGGAIGLYLSSDRQGEAPPLPSGDHDDGRTRVESSSPIHRFPLTPFDAKDTQEAPELAAASGGRVFLTWGSKTQEAERTVFLAHSSDDGRTFDSPAVVSRAGVYKSVSHTEGKAVGYERRSTPHLALAGNKLHLAWSEACQGGAAMRMVLATSTDGGATFSSPRPVHEAERPNATFTALAISPRGTIACAWLGDRAGFQQPFAAVRSAGAGGFETELLVHSGQPGLGVCPCCPLAATFAPDETLYIAYRNVQDGYRDIAVARRRPGQSFFEGPFPVVANTWRFDGCPHDGPSMAVTGNALHLVWMDAHTGRQRCYYARASLDDLTFAPRELHPAGSGTQGNAKILVDSDGRVHAVWEESLGVDPTDASPAGHQHGPPKISPGSGRAIYYASIAPGQVDFGPARPVAPKPGAFQTRPCIRCTAAGAIFIAWNELDETGKAVVVTSLRPEPGASR